VRLGEAEILDCRGEDMYRSIWNRASAEDRTSARAQTFLGLVVQADSVQEVLQLAPDVAHDLIAVMVETHQPLRRDRTVTAPAVYRPRTRLTYRS